MYDIFAQLLAERGVTPYRVYKETGVAQSTLSDWKNGKTTPSTENLSKIADYFDVSLDFLLGKEKAPTIGERKPDIEGAKIALFGGDGEVTDEMWEEAIFAAKLIKERYKRKKD